MQRIEKTELVSSLKEKLTASEFVAIVHYRGMTDKELYGMRVELKARGCNMKIAKNTLVKIAIKGTDLEKLDPYLKGPIAVLYSQDVVALSKIISDVAKKAKALQIITGHFANNLVSEKNIIEMAKLGSLDDVRASFVGVLKGAQSNFVRIIAAPEKGLASLKTA